MSVGLIAAPPGETSRSATAPNRTVAPSPRWLPFAVAALLAGYAAMALSASRGKGLSFDEGVQLAVGYNIWLHDDYRVEGANGDLVKRWATLPYLFSRPVFLGQQDPLWQNADSYEFGRRFFFGLGNRPESLLQQGRAMMVLLGVATGWLVFDWAREMFGAVGGVLSLGLFSFSPHMLAFGGIVSTDMAIILTLLASTWCIWRLLHALTMGRVLGSLACFGLLLLAKMTALVILPITGVLLVVRFVAGQPLEWRWRGRSGRIAGRSGQAAIFAGLILLHAFAGWTAIWAHYDFRYVATPPASGLNPTLRAQSVQDGRPGVFLQAVRWSREARLFPEGYLRGVEWLLGTDDKLPAFMAGRAKLGGWRTFFPYAIWVKTQPTLFVLLGLGAWAWWRARRAPNLAPALYAATPHVVLIAVFLGVAVTEDINLGHRHVLPIYPSLYVLAGAATLTWRRDAPVG